MSARTARSPAVISSREWEKPGRRGCILFRCCERRIRSEPKALPPPMPRIDRASLMSLETYARERPQFRAKVIAHKKDRTIALGDHVTLLFEDELTIRYQVQE